MTKVSTVSETPGAIKRRRWRLANIELAREIDRLSYHRHKRERLASATANRIANIKEELVKEQAWRDQNREKVREACRRYRERHREERNERARELHAKNPEKRRASYRKWAMSHKTELRYTTRFRRYKITREEIEKIATDQENKCAVCHREFDRTPHVDHDHVSGKVRGLLCANCNLAIGSAGDSPDRLRAMAAYLDRHLMRDTVWHN
jgi:hypothetical protein